MLNFLQVRSDSYCGKDFFAGSLFPTGLKPRMYQTLGSRYVLAF